MFKLFIKIILLIEIIIFGVAGILIFLSSNDVGIALAHFTGAITFITLSCTLIYLFTKLKYIKPSIFILCSLSLILMICGYFFFLFEHISPYTHAGASLNFDIATSWIAITVAYLINNLSKNNDRFS